MDLPRLTVICPVYEEEEVVKLFHARLRPVLDKLSSDYACELVFLDNASQDNTRESILEIQKTDPSVYYILLRSNVGYQRSVECGLRNTHGDFFVIIDVDCEDPPEMIEDFLATHKEGFDIVYGQRVDRHEPAFIKYLRKIFYRLTKFVSDENFILDMAEFCLMTSDVKDAITQDNTSFPFIRASIGRVGFKRTGIPYKRDRRIAGKTHYNIATLIKFAVAGILSSSTMLLRLPAYSFPFWLITLLFFGITNIITGSAWSAMAAYLCGIVFIGFTTTSISIYVARIYKNTLGRPNYFIDKGRSKLQPEVALNSERAH